MSSKTRSNNALLIIATAEEYNRRKIVLTRGIKESLMSVRAIYLAVPDAQDKKKFQIYSVASSVYSPKGIEAFPRDACVKNNVFTWSKDFANSIAFAGNDVPEETVHGLLNAAYTKSLKGERGQIMGNVHQTQDLDFVVQINTRKDPITRHVSSFSGKARNSSKTVPVSEKNTSQVMLDRVIDKLGPEAVLRHMVKSERFTGRHTAILHSAMHEMGLLTSDEINSIRSASSARTAISLTEVDETMVQESFAADECDALAERVALTLSLRNAASLWMNWPMLTAGLRIMIVPRTKNSKYSEILLTASHSEGNDFAWRISMRETLNGPFHVEWTYKTPVPEVIREDIRRLVEAVK